MPTILWSIGSDLLVKWLAVFGAFALGAMLLGWLTQTMVMLAFRQKIPLWPMWLLRLLGGVLLAWVAYLWLFGSGGNQLGGPGGPSSGAGKDKGKDRPSIEKAGKEKDGSKDKDSRDKVPPVAADTLIRIEVLGDDPLRKIAKTASLDTAKRYRLVDDRELRTFEEVQKFLRQRRTQQPPLKVVQIVLYQDSPSPNRDSVLDLERWLKDLAGDGKGELIVDIPNPKKTYAPVD